MCCFLDRKLVFGRNTVFSRTACILNLIAFTAHAVFGCCGHHQHENQFDCCGTVIQNQHSVLAVECCDSESRPHHGNCSDSECANDVGGEPGNDGQRHGCNEGRCSYIGTSSSNDSLTELVSSISANWIGASINVASIAPCRARYIQSGAKIQFATPATLCAALQSWQI